MPHLLDRSHRAPATPRRGPTEPTPDRAEQEASATPQEEAGSVRMRLKDVFVSTNAALLERPDGAERIVVFAPKRTGALRRACGGDIQAILEGIQLVDWWPVGDGAPDGGQPPG